MRRLVVLPIALAVLATMLPAHAAEPDRITGASRFDTAAAIALRAFPDEAATVYLARADVLDDAVVAGTLTDGPVLLVPSCGELPDVVAEAIEQLDPTMVTALGGRAAVCDDLLDDAAEGRDRGRLFGASRYDTAVAISQAAFPDAAETVYVARAAASPDAVAGGSLTDGPILLVPPAGEVPDQVTAEVDRLGPARVVALGGSAAVSDDALAAVAGDRPTGRLAGPDRFATAAAIAEEAFGDDAGTVYLARADVFADAVAGGALTDGPLLLVPSCGAVPGPVRQRLAAIDPATVVALGGTGAVCDELLQAAASGEAPTVEPTRFTDETEDVFRASSAGTINEPGPGTPQPGEADITGWSVAYGDEVTLTISLVAPLAPGEVTDTYNLDWELDLDDDGEGDVRAYVLFSDGGITGEVSDVNVNAGGSDRRGEVRCAATATFEGGVYAVAFPASCIGDPAGIASTVDSQFDNDDQGGSRYFDFAPNDFSFAAAVARE